MKIYVVLTDHQASFVEQMVASGRYQNVSEVLREGLRLVERREWEASARLSALMKSQKQSRQIGGYLADLRVQFKPKRDFIRLLNRRPQS